MKVNKASGYVSVALLMSFVLFLNFALHLTTSTASARMHSKEPLRHAIFKEECKVDADYCD